MAAVALTDSDGNIIPPGALHNLFGPAVAGDPTDYRFVEVRASVACTGLRAWLSIDGGGAVVAIASGDTSARAASWMYAVDPTTLTYTTPTSKGSGVALPDLSAGQKALIIIRRTLTGASAATPETNALLVGGTA